MTEPVLRLGLLFEVGIPEGGADGEDDAVVVRVARAGLAGQAAFGEGGVLGASEDEFVGVAGGQRRIDAQPVGGLGRDDPEINLIPLIDVLLVILIFLMVTTTYARFAELQINLPEAKGESAKEVPFQLSVDVDATGKYRVNDGAVAGSKVEDVEAALLKAAGDKKEPVVVINADALTSHQSVIRVMDAARRLGFTRVTFVTQTPASGSP